MLKTVEQLAKAFGDLRQHFKKAAAHHEALSAAHAGLAEADKAHHEFVKAKAEAMDDGDLNKTYFGKCSDLHKARAAFHVQKAALHKAHAAHLASLAEETAEGEAEKSANRAAASTGTDNKNMTETAPGSVEGMVKATTDELVKSALEMVKTDPTVKEEIKKMVLEAVKGGLGDKIVPTNVKTVLPTHPTGPTMVPRPGGPPAPVEGVPVEFEDLVRV